MGFGSFMVNMGEANAGYNAGVDTNRRRAEEASQLQRMRQQDQDDAALRANNSRLATEVGQLPGYNTQVTQQPGQPTEAGPQMPPAPAIPKSDGYAAPAPAPAPKVSGINPEGPIAKNEQAKLKSLQQQRDAAQAELDAYNADPNNKYAERQATVGNWIGQRMTNAANVLPNIATAGKNAVNEVASSVMGRQVMEPGKYDMFQFQPTPNRGQELTTRLRQIDEQLKTQRGVPMPLSDADKAKAKAETAAVRTKAGLPVNAADVVDPKAAAPFLDGLSQQYGLPQGLLQRVLEVESGGRARPNEQGSGANGYFQFMPATAKQYGVQIGNFQSEANGAARYLSELAQRYGGDWSKALAAYGGGLVNGQITPNGQAYVAKYANLGQQPAAGGAPVPPGTTMPPQVAAAPQAGQPAQPAQSQTVQNPQIPVAGGADPAAQQRQLLQQHLIRVAQSSQGEVQAKALEQLMNLRTQDQAAQLSGIAAAARTDQGAMQQLTGLYNQYSNAGIGVQVRPDGTAVMHDRTGRVLGQGTTTEVATYLQQQIDPALRAANIASMQEAHKKLLDYQAQWQGLEGPKALAQGQREGNNHIIQGNMEIAKELAKINATPDKAVRTEVDPNGTGVYAFTEKGRTLHIAPPKQGKDKYGLPFTTPAITTDVTPRR